MNVEQILNYGLVIALLLWLVAAINMYIAVIAHSRAIKKYERRLKLPKGDFYDPRTNEFRRSYWQRINNIETR